LQVTKLFNFKKNTQNEILPAQAPLETEFSADSSPAIGETEISYAVEDTPETAQHDKWIAAAQRGDVNAFNDLVTFYEQRVYNLCYRLLGDSEAAADATQDAFLNAYKALSQYRGGSFKSWLLRIASNQCYDQLRAKARRPASSLDAMLEEAEENGGAALAWMEDEGADPQEHSLRREMLREVGQALEELPFEQRLVVVLSDVQGMSYEEIVEITNCSLGTIKSRLSRGRLKLREILHQNRELFRGELRP
jgi:RNA polymerase sigma-70 factor (ECF subfamily)